MPLTLEESARRLGALRWWELRLFELLGRWAVSTPEHDVKLLLATNARHHAWHADLLRDRLPEVRDLDPDGLTVAPSVAAVAYVASLGELDAADLTIEKMVVAYRVLVPRLVAAQRQLRDVATPVADAAVIRTLTIVGTDTTEDWAGAQSVIDGLVTDGAGARRAGECQARHEASLVAAGGIVGS